MLRNADVHVLNILRNSWLNLRHGNFRTRPGSVALGCPAEKSAEMAAQLDKRARQLAAQKGRSYEEALQHLLS